MSKPEDANAKDLEANIVEGDDILGEAAGGLGQVETEKWRA
jgi:hypothetical protein